MGKIPDDAKCVFKGILFEVYQWEQKMFDNSYQTFERVKRLNSSQIICVTENNKIIVLEEEQPGRDKFTGLVGGMIERKEKPEENAKKELLEETGMVCENLKLWKVDSMGGKINWDTYYFIAKNCKKIQDPKPENGERIIIKEVNFDQFLEEVEKTTFRNKNFRDMIFRMRHTKGEIEKLEKKLFEND